MLSCCIIITIIHVHKLQTLVPFAKKNKKLSHHLVSRPLDLFLNSVFLALHVQSVMASLSGLISLNSCSGNAQLKSCSAC